MEKRNTSKGLFDSLFESGLFLDPVSQPRGPVLLIGQDWSGL